MTTVFLLALGLIGVAIMYYVLRENNIIPHLSTLETDINKSKGWCHIGDKTCIDSTNKSDCMSGDIFPTKAMCINSKLR